MGCQCQRAVSKKSIRNCIQQESQKSKVGKLKEEIKKQYDQKSALQIKLKQQQEEMKSSNEKERVNQYLQRIKMYEKQIEEVDRILLILEQKLLQIENALVKSQVKLAQVKANLATESLNQNNQQTEIDELVVQQTTQSDQKQEVLQDFLVGKLDDSKDEELQQELEQIQAQSIDQKRLDQIQEVKPPSTNNDNKADQSQGNKKEKIQKSATQELKDQQQILSSSPQQNSPNEA